MLPNFFIVGAAKAGTSSLWQYLHEHPEVYMANVKEPNFFSYEEIIKQNIFWKDVYIQNKKKYEKLFNEVNQEIAIGEASVSYLFYPETPCKIKSVVPNAKIIISLRNPIDRGFSHYKMDFATSKVLDRYEDIINNPNKDEVRKIHYQQYVTLGLYYDQVKRYIECFGRENIMIILNEELYENPKYVCQNIFTFLNVDNQFIPNLDKKHNESKVPKNIFIKKIYSSHILRKVFNVVLNGRIKIFLKKLLFNKTDFQTLSPEMKQILFEIYKEDINKLEKLIDKDLSSWKIISGDKI